MNMQDLKRNLTAVLLGLPVAWVLSACKVTAMSNPSPLSETQRRFKGMGLALVVDAVEGAEMLGVEFFADGKEFPFYASSVTRKGNREIMAFPSGVVPENVRVVWRDTSKLIRRADNPRMSTYAGNIIGDYTVLIANRIPDEVVKEIRKNGGGLRLKFRLKPNAVMFGWDIERFGGGLPKHTMPGGDFLQTEY